MLLYFKKARSGAPSGILEQGGGTQCRKERHSAAFLSPRESPRWCTKECLTRKCRAFFCCSISRRHDLVQRRRYSNRAAARSAVRNATVRRSLARGRVPGNVAGVERRGDGERQGLEIKKCKFARVFMATISLMVICCEIFSIEENWGKRRGEGTPPYGWGRVRCGFLMCRTAGRGVVG